MSHVEFLPLSSIDPIYSSYFHLMIKEAFRDHKHFIVAKIKSRPHF